MEFEFKDHLIDFIAATFFLAVIFNAMYGFFAVGLKDEKHKNRARIVFSIYMVVSVLFINQTMWQIVTGGFAPFRIWDILNYLQAIAFLMSAQIITKAYGVNYKNNRITNKKNK